MRRLAQVVRRSSFWAFQMLWLPLWYVLAVDGVLPYFQPFERAVDGFPPGFYDNAGRRVLAAPPGTSVRAKRMYQVLRRCTAIFVRSWRGVREDGGPTVWPLPSHSGSVALEPGPPVLLAAHVPVPIDAVPGTALRYVVEARDIACLPLQRATYRYPILELEVGPWRYAEVVQDPP